MCLLDYRKLFTVNQTRVQAIQNRINRTIARASLPRIQDDVKISARESEDAKLCADGADEVILAKAPAKSSDLPDRAPSGRLRKKILDPSSSSSSEHSPSTSEVEYPVEGCHTDSEREELSDGNSTPIVVRTAAAFSQHESQPTGSSTSTLPRIPRKKNKKSKHSKKSKESGKHRPKKSRVSGKKAKKHRSKKTKKAPLPSPSSSSCSEESGSESDEEVQAPVLVDQVL